ncbi:MAG: hypothetical protein D9C04_04555 [Nitrosopumilus sp. B06]|nr:MAG: hypothetical protein EB828_00555 [Nitrosopumilus sp. D6]RNJ79489.1 MAG: hypothetical protein D9C04_04555 [Nitrosopumilus sp. B06]
MNANKLTGIGMLLLGLYISLWPAVGVFSYIFGEVDVAWGSLQGVIITFLLPLCIGVTLAVIGAKLTRIPNP